MSPAHLIHRISILGTGLIGGSFALALRKYTKGIHITAWDRPDIVARALRGEAVNSTRFEHDQPYHVETLVRNPGVSTFVNITKGCDNFCTFCVVPFTRGRERSRPATHVLDDVKKLVDETIGLMAPKAREKGLVLSHEVDERLRALEQAPRSSSTP